MSRHSTSQHKTVADLVEALGKIDQSLPVVEGWDGIPGWFEVDDDGKRVTIGVYLDSCYAEISDLYSNVLSWDGAKWTSERDALVQRFGGLELPDGYNRMSWPYGD